MAQLDEASGADAAEGRSRRFSTGGMVGAVLASTALPSFVAVFFLGGGSAPPFPDRQSVMADLLLPQALALLITAGVITWLGWWRKVLGEDRRTRAWVWVVPAALVLAALPLIDDARVMSAGGATTLTLAAGVLLGVTSEELLFRGAILTEMRGRRSERRAAWTTSIVFGLSHVLGGPVQAVVSVGVGHLYYLTRRVSGGPWVPIVAHAAWNVSVATAWLSANPAERSTASAILVLIALALFILVVVARSRIDVPARDGASD